MRLYRMLEAIDSCPAPVVARVQGYALGGGSGLVACADVAIAVARRRLRVLRGAARDHPRRHLAVRVRAHRHRCVPALLPHGRALRRGRRRSASASSTRSLTISTAPSSGCASLLAGRARGGSRGEATRPRDSRAASALGEIAATRRASAEGQEGLRAFLEKRPANWLIAVASAVACSIVRRLMILAGAIVVVDTMFFAALTPLLPDYADDFGLSKAGAGLLQAAYPLGVLVGSIPSGYIAARFGVKPTAIGALLLIAGDVDRVRLRRLDRRARLDALRPGHRQRVRVDCGVRLADRGRAGRAPRPVDRHRARCRNRRRAVRSRARGARGRARDGAGVQHGRACSRSSSPALPSPPTRRRRASSSRSRRLWEALFDRRIVGGLWLIALPALLFGTLTVLAPLRAVRSRRRRARHRRGLRHCRPSARRCCRR